jgi:hypothetical protein
LTVDAQRTGLSLLSPRVTVYAADQVTVLGNAAATGQYGATVTVTVPNVVAGQLLYVKVKGAETTTLGTGLYALGLSFDGTAPPTEASKVVPIANGAVLTTGGGLADTADSLTGAVPMIRGITPDTGASNNDGVTNATRISLLGTAPANDQVSVYRDGNLVGTTTAGPSGNWTFNYTGTSLADGVYQFTATTTDANGAVSDPSFPYQVTIDTKAPTGTQIERMTPSSSLLFGGTMTAARNPTIFGSAAPSSTVNLYSDSQILGSTATDRNGNWNFTVSGSGLGLGWHAITATATDIAGNTGTPTSSLFLEEVMPSVWNGQVTSNSFVTNVGVAAGDILGTVLGWLKVDSTPTLQGQAVAGSQVAIFEDSVMVGLASVDFLGHWSYTTDPLTSGTHTFTFMDYDLNGDHGAASGKISILA